MVVTFYKFYIYKLHFKLLLLLLLLLATMTLNQVQSFRINHQAGSHYINI